MKRILSLVALGMVISSSAFSQSIQASIGAGTQDNRVKVYLKTDVTQASTISTLQFNVGVDATNIVTAPTLTLISNGLGIANNGWTIGVPYLEGGYWNYNIFTSTSPLTPSFTSGVDFEAMELEFSNGVPATGKVGLVTLPDGGATTFAALFYCTGTVNSNGLGNLYYLRSGVTVDNQNSYDPSGSTAGTGTSVASIPSVVLPVKFLSFNAAKSNNTALLTWAVEHEDANTASYEVLKSVNGIDFTSIKTLAPAGNGRSSNTYNFTVENLSSIRSSGVIYFRIKQTDKDGKAVYTDIKNVRLSGNGLSVAVYPNPVKNTANVSFDMEETAEISIAVVDALGKQLSVKNVKGIKGANITAVDMSRMAAGNYTLKLQTATETKVVSVVKAQN